MFDRIAPRYDLVNRIMTFRLDVGWRRQTVRALRLPMGSRVLDLACGTGDLCRELEHASLRPIGVDFSLRHALAGPHRRTARAGRRACGCPCPTRASTASRVGSHCGTSSTSVPSSPSSLGSSDRTAMSRCSKSPNLGRASSASGTACTSARSYPESADCCRTAARTATCRSRWRTYRRPRTMLDMLRATGFEAVERRPLSAGIAQLIVGTRSAVSEHDGAAGRDPTARRRRRPGRIRR